MNNQDTLGRPWETMGDPGETLGDPGETLRTGRYRRRDFTHQIYHVHRALGFSYHRVLDAFALKNEKFVNRAGKRRSDTGIFFQSVTKHI
ncbi:hypothetical protein EYF80_064114 [Liparis tanakae]|uniref:Uncharacterized protein n=1 Tax=Liparis tanakae TaxID=230148 RepID=A0A4Z2EB38_9TELE|nr:hypothetical protein EYF80_064114 [Liparis tanakae]